MTGQKQHGFTIIETMLYLGVSALLLAGLLGGVTIAIQRQRFSDSVATTQGFVQQQFNETQNTLNNRPGTESCQAGTPGSGNPAQASRGASQCLVAGKLLDFAPSGAGGAGHIRTHNVLIGANVSDDYTNYTGGDIGLFQSKGANGLNTTVVQNPANDATFDVPWGASLPQLYFNGSSPKNGTPIRYIALLRSPISGSISLYYLTKTSDLADNSEPLASTLRAFAADQAARVCINSADISTAKALLKIAAIGTQDGVTTHFDNDPEQTAWCP